MEDLGLLLSYSFLAILLFTSRQEVIKEQFVINTAIMLYYIIPCPLTAMVPFPFLQRFPLRTHYSKILTGNCSSIVGEDSEA